MSKHWTVHELTRAGPFHGLGQEQEKQEASSSPSASTWVAVASAVVATAAALIQYGKATASAAEIANMLSDTRVEAMKDTISSFIGNKIKAPSGSIRVWWK